MATHPGILAWRTPWTEESLVGYSLWSRKKSDMTVNFTHSDTPGHQFKIFNIITSTKTFFIPNKVGLNALGVLC